MKSIFWCDPFDLAYTIGWLGVVCSIITLFGTILEDVLQTNEEIQKSFHNKTTAILLAITICLVHLLISLLLIIGTAKRRRSFLLPWLVYVGIEIVLSFIFLKFAALLIIILIIFGKFQFEVHTIFEVFFVCFIWIILIALNVLRLRFWQVIYSLYRHLEENENGFIIQQNIQYIEGQPVTYIPNFYMPQPVTYIPQNRQ